MGIKGCLTGFAGSGFSMVVLQVLRVFTLVGLTTVMVSCWVLAIKINMDKTYFVFDAASLVFMSGMALFLALSELPFGKKFFLHNWPAFSTQCGLGWLGLALIIIGCNTLGKLNNANTESKKIGMPWWQLVLASGILNIVFGCLNVIATFAFHDWSGGNNARVVRSNGADSTNVTVDGLPRHKDDASSYSEKKGATAMFRSLWGGGKDNHCKTAARPPISGPFPAHNDPERDAGGAAPQTNDPDSDSLPQMSPIAPNVQRPESLLHPHHKIPTRPASSYYRPESTYSAARWSRFSRFTRADRRE
jgi:hypothetical protein